MNIGIFGNLSSGKTALAVSIIYQEYQAKQTKVITNIDLKFPNVKVDLPELIDKTRNDPDFFRNAILFLDEIHVIIDARRSMADINQKFTQFLTQLGKLDCNLIFTAQILNSQIDLRLRELMDIYVICEKMDERGNKIYGKRVSDKKVYFMTEWHILVKAGTKEIVRKIPYDLDYVFPLYDTRELVIFDRDAFLKK